MKSLSVAWSFWPRPRVLSSSSLAFWRWHPGGMVVVRIRVASKLAGFEPSRYALQCQICHFMARAQVRARHSCVGTPGCYWMYEALTSSRWAKVHSVLCCGCPRGQDREHLCQRCLLVRQTNTRNRCIRRVRCDHPKRRHSRCTIAVWQQCSGAGGLGDT